VKPTWEELFPDSSPRKKPTFDEVMSTPKANVTSLPEIQASGPSRIEVGRIEVESSPSKPTLRPTQRTPYAQQRFNFQVSAPKLAPTPQKTELPAEYLTDDSTLTPQQVIEKYRKIAQDTTLPKKEREKLIKQGKDVLGNIMQANNKLKTFGYKPLYENVTPEEAKQAQDVYSLLQTRTAGAAVMANTLDSLTFGFGAKAFDSVNDKILEKAKEAGVDVPDAPTLTQITQQSKEEHPVASVAGQLIGRVPIYQGLGAVLGKVPAYVALQSGKLPARLVAGRIIDVVPDALDAISQEDNTADRIKQFAINQATGLVFDTALEGLGAAVKAGTKKLRPNAVAESAAKSVDTPTLKPAEAPTIKPEAPSLKPTETPAVKPVEPELKPKGIDDIQAKTPTEPTFGKNTVGAAESKFPRKQKTSKVFSNTFENSNLFTQAEKNVSSLLLTDSDIKYDVITEKQSLAEAAERLAHDFDGEVAELPTKAYFDSADTDAAMMVLERRIQEARESGNYDEVLRWTRIIKEKGTEAGQRIQAFAKYSRTPEHALVQAQRVVDSVEDAIKAPMKNGKYPAGAKPKLWKEIEDETSRVVDAVKKAEKSASQAAAETMKKSTDDVMQQYIEDATKRLSKSIDPETVKKTPPALQQGFNDLVSELNKIAKEVTPPKSPSVPRNDPVDVLKSAIQNKDKYETVWENAKKTLREKYKNNEAVLKMLDDFFNKEIIPPYSQESFEKAFDYTVKKLGIDIKDLILNNPQNKAEALEQIKKYIIEQTGASGAEAELLIKQIGERYSDILNSKNMDMLENLIRERVKKAPTSEFTKLKQLMNLGAFYSSEYDIPTDAAVSKAIKKSVKELGEDLNNIIKQSKGDKEKLLQNVKDYILENTGITGDNADILAERVTEQYRKILAEKTEAALNNMFREPTPKGKKSTKQRIMELINMGAYDNAAIKDAIKQRHGLPVLEPEDVKQILDYMEQAAKLPENSRERLILEAKAVQVVRNKKPVGLKDKFITTLYDNMLGNFRTLISRNAGGNLMFAIPETIREVPTAMIDKGVSLVTGERTRTMPSLKKLKAYGQGFAKGFSDQISDYKLRVDTPTSGNVVDFDGKPTKVFKNKIMDELDRLVKTGLSLGDRPFYEANYAKRLAELEEIKNMGKLGKEFVGKDFDEIASMLAKADALEATFQSKGIISEGLEKIKQGLGNLSKGYFGVDLLSQTTLPFTRTFGDLAERAIEYSPLGIGLNTVKTIGEVAGGNFNQRRFVDEAGRNLLGLGFVAAAYAGVKSGNIVGSLSKDKDERAAQYQAGMKPYSVKIGDTWHTYDWVPGIGAAVAATADATQSKQNNETLPSTLGNLLKATGNSLVEQQPVAQGLKSLVGYGDIASGVGNTILSGTGQLVPSFVRQAANTLDPITRETYDPNPLKQQLNYLKSGVPGLRQTLPQKVDTTGEGVLQNQGRGLASRAMENMLIPQLISQVTSDPVRNELLRINKETGETKQFLKSADKTLTVDGEKYHLDTGTYIQYQTLLGQKTNSIVSDMIQSAYYKLLSDEEKAEAIYSAQVYANALAKRDILNAMGVDYEPDSKYLKQEALEQAGVPYVKQWEIYSTADADGNNSISQSEWVNALANSNLTDVQRAYIFQIQNSTAKKNPFEIAKNFGIPFSAVAAYYAAESSKKPNGETIPGSLKRNAINAMVNAGADRTAAVKFWNAMNK